MNYKRILAIGDIHGEFDKFMSMYKKVKATDEDLIIYLGDYIDRGKDNIKALKWIINESKKDNVIALRGNHEQMMLDFFDNDDYNWLCNGGDVTIKELKQWIAVEKNALTTVFELLDGLKYYHKMEINGEEYIFCHAGIRPTVQFDKQLIRDLLWIREEFFVLYDEPTKIVAGHTPVMYLKTDEEIEQYRKTIENSLSDYKSGKLKLAKEKVLRTYSELVKVRNPKPEWRRDNKILMMDTGSYLPNGRVSCVDILTGEIWQND